MNPHTPIRTLALALAIPLATLATAACDDSTGPEAATFQVELKNFTNVPREMGVAGEALVTLPGDVSTGTPSFIRVANPGVGGTLDFVAVSATETLRVTCTVTNDTNVSEAPQVVVQPAFNELDCVSW